MSDASPPENPGESGQPAPQQPEPEQMRHQQISARVPEHVAGGVFSTGALVITGASEFVLDFVLRAMRPHQIVARVVLPHPVMPQFLRVLEENVQRYEQRFGAIPSLTSLRAAASSSGASPAQAPEGGSGPADEASAAPPTEASGGVAPDAARDPEPNARADEEAGTSPESSSPASSSSAPLSSASPPASSSPIAPPNEQIVSPEAPPESPPPNQPPELAGAPSSASTPPPPSQEPRRPSVEEIYGELKLPDELLSGVYANAVMISHSPGTFSFDFITSFYPRSAVAARVFLPAVYVPPLLDSMKGNWQHLQRRQQQAHRRRRDRDA